VGKVIASSLPTEILNPASNTKRRHSSTTTTMGAPFDFAPERPEQMQNILDGLDRYNPETTSVFQDYVMQQCESQTYDCYANLALLKLYVVYFPFFLLCYMMNVNHNVSYYPRDWDLNPPAH
jgi:hypothetical protein